MMACKGLYDLNHLFLQLILLFPLFTTLTFRFLEKAICFPTWGTSAAPLLHGMPSHCSDFTSTDTSS